VSIRKDAKGCSSHGVTRKAIPTLINGSFEDPGRNGQQSSLQIALMEWCSSRVGASSRYKKKIASRGAAMGPNRK
jgi:hypothetical protein